MTYKRQPIVANPYSPYSRKMLALLRYRQIPYEVIWGDPATTLDAMGIAKPKPIFLPTFLFDNEQGDTEAVCDSTPIIRRLESMVEGRSVIPDDPALAFINFLLEDFGDEWCTKYMFHYRWYFEKDADNAGSLLPLTGGVSLPEDKRLPLKQFFSERQIGRLPYVGSNDITASAIDASYRRFLRLLEAHFQQLPFLLGQRPGSGDFAIYGQLTQLVDMDPTPAAIARELSPRTVVWVQMMEDHSGLSPEDSPWSAIERLPPTLKALLEEIGKTYVPALLANAKALMAGEKQWQTDIDGVQWQQQSFPYQGKCLQWINAEYQALNAGDQQRVTSLLEGTGCEALFNL
ncbi:glutathione S-transferase N-terminal domain-containing protein [Oceanicoccus sagamiensis]|uniref:Glutathione S-transferase n=1 Tax=Oceanicoccus sagamiensis TaxID=716816 RepID=A0A1X9NMV0_9GAMM|nr:glutathione S-transferase N-terminal domain-containing protein [Oceanicoccus sagamiensis]ARN75233.1 glutathione S-transferase [Oceanicoccus sagamiensis]